MRGSSRKSYVAVPYYYKRIIAISMWSMLIFFILISLLTHNAHDSSLLHTTSDGISCTNWGGFWGATCAAFLLYMFGSSSFFLLGLGLFLVHHYAYSISFKAAWDRIAALIIGMLSMTMLSWLYSVDFLDAPYPGGYVGCMLYRHMHAGLGHTTFFCLYMSLVIAGIVFLRFSFLVPCARNVIRYVRYAQSYSRKIPINGIVRWCATRVHTVLKYIYTVVYTYVHPLVGSEPRAHDVWEYELLTESMSEVSTDVLWQDVINKLQPRSLHQENQSCQQRAVSPQPSDVHTLERVNSEITEPLRNTNTPYVLPSRELFVRSSPQRLNAHCSDHAESRARVLEEKLQRFGIEGHVVAIKCGPVVTLFEYKPAIDSKISKIIALEDDLALALQAMSIRIIAPIPGTSVVGFEVANAERSNVAFADIITSPAYTACTGTLPLILGKDTLGEHVVVDLAAMPHLLVAGSTGSGKSVALNTMLVSLLCKRTPDELKLVLIDPKRLEFAPYADIAHLLFPIVTQPKQAAPILQWVVQEMEHRYSAMATCGARTIADYNRIVSVEDKKPSIVVVIDELADLMMTSGKDIETLLARIAQMARAAGIHMIVATQRPSVDVITGLIKVNFPSRISFRVISKVDSRTILDCAGADKLLGKGDMLFLDATHAMIKRVHGAYVSDKEITQLMVHIRSQRTVCYLDPMEYMTTQGGAEDTLQDALYDEVLAFLREIDEVSISLLQRKFRIGYNRSARIIELLELQGLIIPGPGGKIRKVVR